MTRIDSTTTTTTTAGAEAKIDPHREMKTIGLLGGMSPESTIDYYQRINAGVRRALGSHHSARMLLYSANLEQIFDWMMKPDDEALGEHLLSAAERLQEAGADFLVMACNTAHKVAPRLEAELAIPFIHIADVLGEHLVAAGHQKVGLLASQLTAESSFYRSRLERGFGIEALAPSPEDRREVDRVIREELCFHELLPSSRQRFEQIAESLKAQGADAIALACTEIGLLIDQPRIAGLPVWNTTALHAERAVEVALYSEAERPSRAA